MTILASCDLRGPNGRLALLVPALAGHLPLGLVFLYGVHGEGRPQNDGRFGVGALGAVSAVAAKAERHRFCEGNNKWISGVLQTFKQINPKRSAGA